MNDEVEVDNIQEIAVWFWNLFNQTVSFTEFKAIIVRQKLYMDKYEYIYQQVYSDYCDYEKDKIDPRIISFFKERNN